MNVSTSLRQLQPHEHQMRTVYDLDKLAALLLSVYTEGGIRAWHPIVAAANEDGSYRLIHGHRRWLALIFGAALVDWLARLKSFGIDIFSPLKQRAKKRKLLCFGRMVRDDRRPERQGELAACLCKRYLLAPQGSQFGEQSRAFGVQIG